MASKQLVVGGALPRIQSVRALEAGHVAIAWVGGSSQVVDLTPAFVSHRAFVRLRGDDDLFRRVRVSEYQDCLEWPDGSELPAAWIQELADAPLNNEEFRDAMARLDMSLDGMAARLGVARRLIADYRKDKPIPKYIALATRYLLDQRKAS